MSSLMPLSIVVRIVSQVYEKCIYYSAEKPKSEEEAMLCNVILSRYENMRLRIVNGGCDTDVGLKSIEHSLCEVIVYEKEYQWIKQFDGDNEVIDEERPSNEDSCCVNMTTLEKCRDETDMLNVAVNLNLSYTEFKNIISTEDEDNHINVTYEDLDNDADEYSPKE